MKIYVVAHENIVCPKEYRKIEITEEDVEGYIKRSVAYEDMLETLPDMASGRRVLCGLSFKDLVI